MRRRWLYARLSLPWWLFRRLLPSAEPGRSALVLDWRYRHGWGRRAAPVRREAVGPVRLPAPTPVHVCWPACHCWEPGEVVAAELVDVTG